MLNRKRIVGIWVIATLLAIAIGFTVSAEGATKTPFTATLNLLPWQVISPGVGWYVGNDSITQVRDFVVKATTEGFPFDGYAIVEFNWTLHRDTRDGRNWGTITVVTADGGWDTSFSGVFEASQGSSTFVGHGTGANAGLKVKGTFQETTPSSEFSVLVGYILGPGRP